jgi:hypothetical protein
MNTRSRFFIAALAWILPLALVVPYAFFVQRFRVLIWVVENVYPPFWFFIVLSIALSAAASYLLLNVNKLGLTIFRLGAAVLLAHGIYLAMSERRHSLLVILFVLTMFVMAVSEWMRRVLGLPFYFSMRKWWESYPKAVPNLKAAVKTKNDEEFRSVRVANLGAEGCFIFSMDGPLGFTPQVLRLEGPDFSLQCSVSVQVKTRDGLGMGLRFLEDGRDGDWQKDLKDHLVLLGRAGYVAT